MALISAADGVGTNVAGLWFDERCYNEHNYICERPVEGTTDTPYTQAPVTVPSNEGCTDNDNAIGYGSNCFIVSSASFFKSCSHNYVVIVF